MALQVNCFGFIDNSHRRTDDFFFSICNRSRERHAREKFEEFNVRARCSHQQKIK